MNDTLGHEEGDRLPRTMAARLQSCVRDKDSVARLGGDEFIVVLEDIGDPRQPASREKIIATVSAPVELERSPAAHMRASIGISLCSQSTAPPAATNLLKAADAAMYRKPNAAAAGAWRIFSAN